MAADKFLVQQATIAGKKRLSRQTGFIHHCYEDRSSHDQTIPFFENAAFAYALLQSRLSEQMLEGIALLERLLKFEVNGAFPLYLHEYPDCRHPYFFAQLKPIFQGIVRDFRLVVPKEMHKKLLHLLAQEGDEAPLKQALTPGALALQLVRLHADNEALYTEKLEEASRLWHPGLKVYLGEQRQEGSCPEVTLFDLLMGQLYGAYSERALQDNPVHLLGALIPPHEVKPFLGAEEPYFTQTTLFWGKGHSLVSNGTWEEGMATINFSESVPDDRDDGFEVSFFVNRSSVDKILVNGTKATTFQLQDSLQILSGTTQITLLFSIKEGEGRFFGHILYGNRPGQLAVSKFEAYDYRIVVRTISRTPHCQIQVQAVVSSASDGLSTASPMACIPLST